MGPPGISVVSPLEEATPKRSQVHGDGGQLWRGPYGGVHSRCKTALGQAGMQWRVKAATFLGLLEELIRLQLCVAALLVPSREGIKTVGS